MLFRIGDEKARATSIVRYAPGSRFPHHDHPGGEEPDGLELLVLADGFSDGREAFERQSWLRLPAGSPLNARVGPDGATIWLKAAPLFLDNVVQF